MFLLKHSDRQPPPHTSHYTVQHIYSGSPIVKWQERYGGQNLGLNRVQRPDRGGFPRAGDDRDAQQEPQQGELWLVDMRSRDHQAHLWLVQVLSDDIQQAQVDFQVYREKAEVCFKQLEAKNNDINAKWVWGR